MLHILYHHGQRRQKNQNKSPPHHIQIQWSATKYCHKITCLELRFCIYKSSFLSSLSSHTAGNRPSRAVTVLSPSTRPHPYRWRRLGLLSPFQHVSSRFWLLFLPNTSQWHPFYSKERHTTERFPGCSPFGHRAHQEVIPDTSPATVNNPHSVSYWGSGRTPTSSGHVLLWMRSAWTWLDVFSLVPWSPQVHDFLRRRVVSFQGWADISVQKYSLWYKKVENCEYLRKTNHLCNFK